jgi:hypothetical protein
MYLVELQPGKEELYRTGDELAIAIRDGVVDARSRIYHRATAKWISITLHPQYKAIVTGHADAPRPARKAWGLIPAALASQAGQSSTDAANIDDGIRHQRWKGPMGLGLAGILLLLGVQLAFSGPRPPWAGRGKAVAIGMDQPPATTIVSQDEPIGSQDEVRSIGQEYRAMEMVSLASTTTAWPLNSPPAADTVVSPPLPDVAPVAAPALPRAPKLRTKALRAALDPETSSKGKVKASSVQALLSRYDAASNEVYGRLETGMRVARLHRLFSSARLTPGGGVTDTRLSLAGAANFIRVYRQQQSKTDKAYQDTVTAVAKRQSWSAKELKQWNLRPQRKEDPTLELLSGSLLASVDSILGVLDAQAGAYKIRGTAIAFEDPAATEAYGALRRRIKEQIEAAVTAGAATSFGPTGLLLQAIGTSTLPRET